MQHAGIKRLSLWANILPLHCGGLEFSLEGNQILYVFRHRLDVQISDMDVI